MRHFLRVFWGAVGVVALTTGCSDGSGGGGLADGGAGSAGVGGSTGGFAGAGATAGSATGGESGGGAAGSAGAAGADDAGVGGNSGAPPMCSTSSECSEAQVSYPNNTNPPSVQPTECVAGLCGLVAGYSGSYKDPKPPKSCAEICAASTYAGQPMACSPICSTHKINGFGDLGLTYDPGDASAGSAGGLVRYQFSSLSGGYEFVTVGCAEVPKSKLIQGSSSYTYVGHSCCCVAP